MARRLFLILSLLSFAFAVDAQTRTPKHYTAKAIFATDKASIVQVRIGGRLAGTGFVVSKGLVLTASHVVSRNRLRETSFGEAASLPEVS